MLWLDDKCMWYCMHKLLMQILVNMGLKFALVSNSSALNFFLQTLEKGGTMAKVYSYHTSNKYLGILSVWQMKCS